MSARQLPHVDYDQLKAATRRLVKTAGGQEEAALVTRVGHQELSNYGSASPDKAERFMPIDVVADLEAECGQPILTQRLAELCHHFLVPAPQVASDGSLLGKVTAEAMQAVSEVFVELGKDLADGKLTLREASDVEREVDEAIATLMRLKFQVRAEAEATGGDQS